MGERRILVGVIGRPHGVRGLLRLASYASTPELLAAHTLRDDDGRVWRVEWRGDGIAQLFDAARRPVASRDEASRLTNRRLYVDRLDLPEPEPDEFYLADLIGLQARDETGATLGRVAQIHDYGAGVSLEIEPAALIIPFTRASVPHVDLAAGHLTVAVPDEIEIHHQSQMAAP